MHQLIRALSHCSHAPFDVVIVDAVDMVTEVGYVVGSSLPLPTSLHVTVSGLCALVSNRKQCKLIRGKL